VAKSGGFRILYCSNLKKVNYTFMGVGIDKQFLLEIYERMTDEEVIRVLSSDLSGLTAAAREVIKDEVKKRHLDVDLSGIDQPEADESPEELVQEGGCPVPQIVRIWLERAFLALLDIFGEESTLTRKVLIPERSDFPIRYDGSERAAFDTLKIIAEQMEVPVDSITLDFYDERLRQITEGTPGGFYWGKGEAGHFEISIARKNLDEPEQMIAVLAHEIAHIKLLGENRINENDEQITDLTTIFFGLGIFNANAAFRTIADAKYWGWSRLGYLTQMEWGYALSLFAYLRREQEPEWASYLCTNVKGDFFRGLTFIGDNEHLIFQSE
jgi:hypothetical protein